VANEKSFGQIEVASTRQNWMRDWMLAASSEPADVDAHKTTRFAAEVGCDF
jgi:hypothetical protein